MNKEGEKKVGKLPEFVKWFSELNKNSGKVAGGKGANLGEIYNLKIPVPAGFVVTAQAYDYFLKKAGINNKIKELLEKIDYEDTGQLTKITSEIRTIIEKAEFPKEMEEDITDSYETLGLEKHVKNLPAHAILKKTSEEFVAVRSSATTEDLADASFAGQQDTFLNVKGKNELLTSIKKCFSSLFTPRATYYRNKKGFKHEEASVAVIVQKMVDARKSGVIFSKDPSINRDNIIIEAVWGLGEGIVSGKISPDRYILEKSSEDSENSQGISELKIIKKDIGKKKIAITRDSSGKKEIVKLKEEISERQVLKDYEIKKLAEIALKLEEHYKKPQDIEFAIENDEISIVQTRPITTLENRGEAGSEKELKGEIILKGLAASPGIGVGKVKIVNELSDLEKIMQGDILVTEMTNPDMVVTMQKSAAIVTDEGGLTAHASIVSREMGIPAVVGTQEATEKLKDGQIITVDGFTGNIYKGKVAETEKKEVKPIESETRTKIKVIVDLPSFAERASKSKAKSVGLARIEGTIAESGKHPAYFQEKNKMDEYRKIISKGIREIARYFEEIWVRTSDIRSDEFRELEGSPKDNEANPMLGMHGIRYSLKNPDILKAELMAMKEISDEGKKIGVLIPQVISIEDIKGVKELMKEIGFVKARVGVMIETPAAAQIIEEICEEGVDFISFGTNDLTQYTLAVDRGNRQVQNLYKETHPAILKQIEHVIKTCKKAGVETSICGQAGSKKEMAKFLVEQGINSISTNADMASDIAEYVSKLEKGESPKEAGENLPSENENKIETKISELESGQNTSEEERNDEIDEKKGGENIEDETPLGLEDETTKEFNEEIEEKDSENPIIRDKKEDDAFEEKNGREENENSDEDIEENNRNNYGKKENDNEHHSENNEENSTNNGKTNETESRDGSYNHRQDSDPEKENEEGKANHEKEPEEENDIQRDGNQETQKDKSLEEALDIF